MKKRMFILSIIIALSVIFILAGIPMLRYVKEHDLESIFKQGDVSAELDNTTGVNQTIYGREITLDITVEDMCSNPITGEIELECSNPDACKATCMSRGCKLFGLNYLRSEFKANRCYCICYEENKIKKALHIK